MVAKAVSFLYKNRNFSQNKFSPDANQKSAMYYMIEWKLIELRASSQLSSKASTRE